MRFIRLFLCCALIVLSIFGTAAADFETLITSGLPSPDGNGSLTFPNAPAISSAGQLAFVSQLTGTAGGTADNSGLYRYDSEGLTKIARTGESMNVGEVNNRTIIFLFPGSIDSSGKVTGIPALSGPPTLVWYSLGDGGPLVSPFTLGSPSPSGNNTLLGVTTSVVNDAGVMAFRAVFNGGSPEAGTYLRSANGTITTLVKQQTTAPRGGTITSSGTRMTINESSEVAALLNINSSIGSVARVNSSGIHELVREGDVLVGGQTIGEISSTSSFTTAAIPIINNGGQIAFPTQYTTPASRLGVFLADDTGARLITPDTLPSSGGFATTLNVIGLSDTGSAALFAEIGSGSDPLSGVYTASELGTQLIALEDTATPVPGKFFRSFFSGAIASNADGQIAFLAELANTANGAAAGKGLYFYDPQDGLQEIIRTGDSFGGSTVTNLLFNGTFLNASSNQSPDTSVSGMNDTGEVAFAFDLANGQSGLSIWSLASPATGDFDGDGDVDGRDFLVWQRSESPNPLSSGDLALWQEQYDAGGLSVAISVPEPNPVWLVVMCVGVLWLKR